jgi:hypothetical protein
MCDSARARPTSSLDQLVRAAAEPNARCPDLLAPAGGGRAHNDFFWKKKIIPLALTECGMECGLVHACSGGGRIYSIG